MKNHTQNVVEKLVPVPFLKNWNCVYLWTNSLEFYTVCFYCMASWRLSKYIETKLQPDIKPYINIKRGLWLVFLPRFPHNFWRKMFFLLHCTNWPNFIDWLPLLCDILGHMCIAIVCKPSCDVANLEVNLIFQIKPFFLHDQKVLTKT